MAPLIEAQETKKVETYEEQVSRTKDTAKELGWIHLLGLYLTSPYGQKTFEHFLIEQICSIALEYGNHLTHIHDRSISWIGTDISMKV